MRVVDASRRNCNFRVLRERGPSYLLKKSTRRDGLLSTDREALVYDLIHSSRDGRRCGISVPAVHLFDEREHVLILELLPEAEDLRQYHRRTRRFPKWVAGRIGSALAALHRLGHRAGPGADRGRLLAPEPAGFFLHRPGLALLRDFSSAKGVGQLG